jgi:Outer membrane protein beta-barrel domain
MKYYFVINLLCFYLIGNVSLAQKKKPISPKKPTTTVKTTPSKATPKTTVISKPSSTTTPPATTPKVEEKKPVKPVVPSSQPPKTEVPDEQPSSTTVQQSSGPLKGNKLEEEVVKEPKQKRIKTPKIPIEGREIRFGVRAEVTQHYTLEVGSGIDLSPGINIGLLANLPISEQVSIQPEVLYSIINIQTSKDANNHVKSSIGNVLVPLMFNFNFGKNTTKFMLNLGGYANYGLSQSTKVIQAGTTIKDGSVDLGNDRFDYGLGVGVGVKLNNKLIIEARSFYGMKDNINKNGFGTIGVGYLF